MKWAVFIETNEKMQLGLDTVTDTLDGWEAVINEIEETYTLLAERAAKRP